MSMTDKILVDVLALNSHEKIQLVEQVLASLNPSNKGVDATWAEEAEERVTAHAQGHVSAIDAQDVFAKYEK